MTLYSSSQAETRIFGCNVASETDLAVVFQRARQVAEAVGLPYFEQPSLPLTANLSADTNNYFGCNRRTRGACGLRPVAALCRAGIAIAAHTGMADRSACIMAPMV